MTSKMPNILIIHGTYGNPKENWMPWLKMELEKLKCRVIVPRFPTPENQSLDSWMKVAEPYLPALDNHSIIVGHSLGAVFCLSVLERLDRPVKAAMLISGFLSFLDNPALDELNRTFLNHDFDWDRIKGNCMAFHAFSSDNDPYISQEYAKQFAEKIDSDLTIIKGAGHFNADSGYGKFEECLSRIKIELDTGIIKE